jgi:hypothetical protein
MRIRRMILLTGMVLVLSAFLGACSILEKTKTIGENTMKKAKDIAQEASSVVSEKATDVIGEKSGRMDTDQLYLVHFSKLIDAIKNKDKTAVRKLCCKEIQDNSPDFDADIEKMFDFIQGDIQTWEYNGGMYPESIEGDKHIKMENVGYYVYTSKESYYVSLEDGIINTVDPNKIGYQLILIVKECDRDKIYKIKHDGNASFNPTGIVIPFPE